MLEHFAREPFWLQAWISWMVLINTASLFFVRRAGFGEGVFGGWARWLLITNAISLAIDTVDRARFALGDRGLA